MGTKVSQLTEITSASDAAEIHIVENSNSRKIQKSNLLPKIASSVEAIAGTDNVKIITPLTLKSMLDADVRVPKVMGNVTLSGTTPTLINVIGVSSVTYLSATGKYRINFTTAFLDTNYILSCNLESNAPASYNIQTNIINGTKLTTSVDIYLTNGSGGYTPSSFSFAIYGNTA